MAKVSIYQSKQAAANKKPSFSFDIADLVDITSKQRSDGKYCLVIMTRGKSNKEFCYKDLKIVQGYALKLQSGVNQANNGQDVHIPFF